jgi:ribosomal-protein-serine acetyltransferase
LISLQIDEKIQLRSYVPEDAEALFAAVNDSRSHLNPWLSWVSKTTRVEHSLQFIEQSLQQQKETLALGIFYDNILVGGIGMHNWDMDTKRAQLGYWLAKGYEGQNIVHNCLVPFIRFLFEKTGLNKIEIHFVPANKRSAQVADRLGFKIEGIIRSGVLRNGMLEDYVITGLLKSEWIAAGHNVTIP